EACARTRYAAVLMDCQMPEMDGFAATALIRQREGGGPRVPIVALTASVLQADRDRCLAAGMDAYLGNPITIEQVESVGLGQLRRAAVDRPVRRAWANGRAGPGRRGRARADAAPGRAAARPAAARGGAAGPRLIFGLSTRWLGGAPSADVRHHRYIHTGA